MITLHDFRQKSTIEARVNSPMKIEFADSPYYTESVFKRHEVPRGYFVYLPSAGEVFYIHTTQIASFGNYLIIQFYFHVLVMLRIEKRHR